MNWVDWTILAIFSVSTLLSLKRGFVKEALSLAGWVAAFLVAISFSARLSAELADFITRDSRTPKKIVTPWKAGESEPGK